MMDEFVSTQITSVTVCPPYARKSYAFRCQLELYAWQSGKLSITVLLTSILYTSLPHVVSLEVMVRQNDKYGWSAGITSV